MLKKGNFITCKNCESVEEVKEYIENAIKMGFKVEILPLAGKSFMVSIYNN